MTSPLEKHFSPEMAEAFREEMRRIAQEAAEALNAVQPAGAAEALTTARIAAAHVGITERQLRQLASEGAIPCYRFGASLRFKISELESHGRVAERRAKIRAVGE